MVGRILALGLVCAGIAAVQTNSAPVAASTTAAGTPATTTKSGASAAVPAKTYAFDVVSIRQNKSERQMGMPQFGATPDGYRMTNMSLEMVMMTAYVPQTAGSAFYGEGQVKGVPDWFGSERYDIDARISDEDRAEWQKPESQKVMLQAMLQALMVERCKLAVHREVKDASVYSLVVGKSGIKFKEADPTVDPPSGMKLPWGGVLAPSKDGMAMYGTSMASLASLLSTMGNTGRTIQDKTGLTGRYDLVIKFPQFESRGQGEGQSVVTAPDPGSMAFTAAEALGLKLESTKGQVETLVVDHIERPSAN